MSQKLNTYCIDRQPSNPDELLVQCPHCSEWLHAGCLKERAIQDVSAGREAIPPQPKKRGRPSKGKTTHSKSEGACTFDAKIKGGADKTRLTIIEKHEGKTKRTWDVDILCLVCGKIIEEARDNALEEPMPTTPAAQVVDDALKVEEEDQDNTTLTKVSGVGKTPIQDGEADSVIGDADDDQDVDIKAASTSDTESKGETAEPSSSD
jgi:hypothetical protein